MSEGFAMAAGVAVVTGGGNGIGRALCHALAQAGARDIVVTDVNCVAAEEVASAINAAYAHRPAQAMALDVADAASAARVADRVESGIGPIALWCSNAGIHIGEGLGDADDWRRSLDVNLLGHVNVARAVLPRMVGRQTGHLVITASAAGLLTDFRCAPYAASKHAAVALAEWLAITHADDGVSVSCVCPEGVRTGMTRPDSIKAGASNAFLEPEDVAREILDALATRRFLVLPHPRVAEYEQRRAVDRETWLERMRVLRRKLTQAAPSRVAS